MPYSCRHGKKYRTGPRLWLLPVAIVLAMVVLIRGAAHAASYSFTTPTATAFDAAATNVVWDQTCTDFPIDDDKQLVNIGFTFNFGGIDYTQVRILSNGVLHFGADQNFQVQYGNTALPITTVGAGPCTETAADRVIAPYWDDMSTTGGLGSVSYGTLGTAPNRRFVAYWNGVQLYGNTGSYIFQAVLYENGDIRFRYGAGNATGTGATIGVEVSDTDFTQVAFNTAGSVGTANDILFHPINHFAISHDGSNDSCAPEPVTISYHNPAHAVVTTYTGTINLSTSTVHGDWSVITGAGTLVNSGNGIATYTFAAGDNGVVVLGLADTFNETLSINITDGSSVELPAEDPNLTFSNLLNPNTYRDEFNSRLYSNNNGTLNWSGNWAEVGENDGPVNGDEQVMTDPAVAGNYRLRLQDNDNGGEGVERQADLTTFTAATLSFDYRRAGLDNASDYVAIWASGNGGTSWVELGRLSGPATDAAYLSASFDLTPYVAANTMIRFRTSATMGNSDLIYFDNIQIFDPTAAVCAASVDHYELSLPTASITCLPTTVTVTACANTTSPCTNKSTSLSGQTATLASSGGTLATTTATFDGTGLATTTLSYAAAANGTTVTVTLSGESTPAANARQCCPDGTACIVANSCSTVFSTTGFIFANSAGGAGATLPTQVAGTPSSSYYLRAVKTSTTTKACEAALVGTTAVDYAYECNDPTTCSSSNLMSVNSTTIARNNNGSVSSYLPVNMVFDTDGNAPFSFNYDDVGQVTLHARKIAGGALLSNLAGSSNAFVVKPGGLVLSGIQQTAAPQLANPAAANAAGPKFVKAGEQFTASVRATTSGGTTTPNFGKEITPEGIKLTAALVTGLGLSNNPALGFTTGFGAFNNGSATGTDFSWGEVGIITLTPSINDGDYLGVGDVTGAASTNVGRFFPHHFRVVPAPDPPTLVDACLSGGFTYLGQPFTYTAAPVLTITAENQANTTTSNYDCGSFWKLSEPYALDYTYTDGAGTGPTLTPNSGSAGPPVTVPTATTNCNGSVSLTISDNFTYSRPALTAPLIPFPASINLAVTAAQFTDSDGACFDTGSGCQGFSRNNITGASLRLGQTVTSNAYGPETATITEPLLLPVTIQFYNNTAQWVTNSNDNCSQFTYLITPDGSINVNSSPASPVTTTGGRGNLRLWPPNPAADPAPPGGQVRIDYTLPTWLGPDAEAEAFFGIYRGNDRIINWRELVR